MSGTVATREGTAPARPAASPETVGLVRRKVRQLLEGSEAFRGLAPDKRAEIARQTVEVASYLCEPDGVRVDPAAVGGRGAPAAPSAALARGAGGRRGDPQAEFTAQAAREGAAVAGALLNQVNFPDFVAGLIDGVFHSIVKASIEQMEAYGKLVADVAKTLNQFRDENVSPNQGRDYLVDSHPDLFRLDVDTGGEESGPRVVLKDGVDEKSALARVNSLPIEGGPITSLDDDVVEEKLVPAARTQLATSRQQLLATMVLMGINRIIVTDGRISAKVVYDFKARDDFKYRNSATRFDYDKTKTRVGMTGEYESDSQGGERSYSRSEGGEVESERRDASYYTKGNYKYTSEPVVTLASATQVATDASLETRANLTGQVEVNFKSETFPLEKMADSFQIGRIQDASRPGRDSVRSGRAAADNPSPGGPPSPSSTPAA